MNPALGNHELLKKLGAGGMGEVFLARHRRLGRLAAIKVLSAELSGSPEMLQRFFSEARTTSSIRHPGIVDVLDCDVDPSGAAFIVMEYLEGLTLGGILKRSGALPIREVASIGCQVADAVGAAHAKGVVHRDLKPENIFVLSTPARRLKILDFGIAKLLAGSSEGAGLTRTGRLMGTPIYMSPEQCRGTGHVDHRADIYALGCILFEVATGVPPFREQSMGELIAAHLMWPPPVLRTCVPSAPAALEALIAAMLAKSVDERPSSMEEVVRALEPLLQNEPSVSSGLDISPDEINRGDDLGDGDLITLRSTPDAGAAISGVGGTRVLGKKEGTSTLSSASVQISSTVPTKTPKPGRLFMAVAGVALLAGAGAFAWRSARSPSSASGPAPVTNAPVATFIQVNVEAAPPDLTLRVDDRPSEIPAVLAKTQQVHRLVFSAPGYKPYATQVDATRDRTLVMDMKPLAAAPAAPLGPPPATKSEPPPPVKPHHRGRSKGQLPSDVFTDF